MTTTIGQFSFNPDMQTLDDGQSPIRLRKKEFLALASLLESPGELVTTQYFIDNLWNGDRRLGTKGIRQVVWKLRSYFGDDMKSQSYIETIPGIGYRFVYPVHRRREEPTPTDKSWFNRMFGRIGRFGQLAS